MQFALQSKGNGIALVVRTGKPKSGWCVGLLVGTHRYKV